MSAYFRFRWAFIVDFGGRSSHDNPAVLILSDQTNPGFNNCIVSASLSKTMAKRQASSFVGKENMCPVSDVPKKKISTSQPDFRFDFSIGDDDFETMAKGFCPKNTTASNTWALNNFQLWMRLRNETKSDNLCPVNILECTDPETLSNWLGKFITETRRQDGGYYLPKTLNLLLMGLQRHVRSLHPGKTRKFLF